MADRFGRKPVMIFCAFMGSVSEAAILLCPNIHFINGLRLVSGIFRQGMSETFFILSLEILAPSHRDRYGVIVCFKWVVDVLAVGFTAYLLQDANWKYLEATVSISGVFAVLYPFFMEESPRWLTARGRFDEALAIIQRACRQNGKDFEEVKAAYDRYVSVQCLTTKECDNEVLELEPLNTFSDNTKQEFYTEIKQCKQENNSILALFSRRDLTILTLSSWFIWFAHNMTYYGLYMMSSTLVGNRFLNYSLVGFVEIPSIALISVMMRKFQRLRVVKLFLAGASCSLMAYSLLNTFGGDGPLISSANIVAFLFGKFSIAASYNVLFILTPEIYPTVLRSTATASCNSFSRIGSMLVPFLRPLITVVKWGPGVIFTGICFIALLLMFFLPETKDKELVDTVEDFKKNVTKKKQQKT